MTPNQKVFDVTRKELNASLIERDQEIDIVLTALVAQEHCLFVGPPGTAKSMLADAVTDWLAGDKFSILVNKFTTPEEVFGPISVSGLKNDHYKRITTGKLPEADIAFIDEIFKSSSAILNTTLRILNERTYANDDVTVNCPLKLCVAASNEWPGEDAKELGALFDRFLFRRAVRPVSSERGFDRLCWSANLTPSLSTQISPADVDAASAEARAIQYSAEAKESFVRIVKECKREGVVPGDRRIRKSVDAVRAYAWLNGGVEVETDHLEILAHLLWEDPFEQPRKVTEIVSQIANPASLMVNSVLMEAEQILGDLDTKDLVKVSTASKKLTEIKKKLNGMNGSKAKQAADYVAEKIKEIKLATVEAL